MEIERAELKYFLVLILVFLKISNAFGAGLTHAELFARIASKLNKTIFVDVVDHEYLSNEDVHKSEVLLISNINNIEQIRLIVEPLGYGVLEFSDDSVILCNLFSRGFCPDISLSESKYRINSSVNIVRKFTSGNPDSANAVNKKIFDLVKSGKINSDQPISMDHILKLYPKFKDSLFQVLMGNLLDRVERIARGIYHVQDNPASIYWKKIESAELLVSYGKFGNNFGGGQSEYILLSGNSTMTIPCINEVIGKGKKRWLLGTLDFPPGFASEELISALNEKEKLVIIKNNYSKSNSVIGNILKSINVDYLSEESWIENKKLISFGGINSKDNLIHAIKILYKIDVKIEGGKILFFPEKNLGNADFDKNIISLINSISPEIWRSVNYRAYMLSKRDIKNGRPKIGLLEADIYPEYLIDNVVAQDFSRKLVFNIKSELNENQPSINRYSLKNCNEKIKNDFSMMFYDCLLPVISELYIKKHSKETAIFKNLKDYSIQFNSDGIKTKSLSFFLIDQQGKTQMVTRLSSSTFE